MVNKSIFTLQRFLEAMLAITLVIIAILTTLLLFPQGKGSAQADIHANPHMHQGWNSSVQVMSMKNEITSIDEDMVVPPSPPNDGRVDFFFPAFEPQTQDAIIQPVLQYGTSAAGGHEGHWYTSLWYISDKKKCSTTNLREVHPGEHLHFWIKNDSAQNNTYTYSLGINNAELHSNDHRTLSVDKEFDSIYSFVMENYDLTSCRDLPPATITVKNVILKSHGQKINTIDQAASSSPMCLMDRISISPGDHDFAYDYALTYAIANKHEPTSHEIQGGL